MEPFYAKMMCNHPLLEISVSAVLPLRIHDLVQRGGPTPSEWEDTRGFADDLGSRGDNLLYRSSKKGETAELFNRFTRALAVMAFVPGGIHFCGVNYCHHHPGGRRQAGQVCEECGTP